MSSDALTLDPVSGEHAGGWRSPWSIAAYGVAAVLAFGVAACAWGIPLQFHDFATYLVDMAQSSTWQVLVDRFQSRANFRPLFYLQLKALLESSRGHYFVAFKTFYVAELFASMLLIVRLLKIRSAAAFVAGSLVIVMVLGIHTTIDLLREGPLTSLLAVVLALNVMSASRSRLWQDVAAVSLLIVTTLTVELGLLIWVIYVVGWWLGWRGISTRAVVVASVLVGVYFGYRFTLLNPQGADLELRWTGVGFARYEPEQLLEMFRTRMPVLYGYNVLSSMATVLLSEPRAGVWYFAQSIVTRTAHPWVWLTVFTSVATTGCLAWYAWIRLPQWRRREWSDGDRLMLVGLVVIAANAAISHRYTRDVIMHPAGVCYALAAYPALEAALTRLPSWPRARRRLAVWLLLALSIGWTVRAAGTFYLLRTTAFDKRNEWSEAVLELEERQALPAGPPRDLLLELRRDALSRPAPYPSLAQPWLGAVVEHPY